MSKTSKVMSSVSTAFSFAGDKVMENLSTYINSENIELTTAQKNMITSIVKSSVQQSFVLTADSIERTISSK